MKILIIGSKGFIGSHLYQYFKSKGYEVYGSDVVVDYETEGYFLIDSSNADYNDVFQYSNFDLCVNCSGAASVPNSLDNPLRDFNLNTHNVFKILEAIRKYNHKCKFLNLSSAAVYGNPLELPVKEDQNCSPVSPYGYHKWMSEQICSEFVKFFNLRVATLRIFSAYGEGLKKQLFWDLYQKSLHNNPIQLFGTGEETRDFIYIKDLLRLIELVGIKSNFRGECINAANGEEIQIKEVVQIFLSTLKPSLSAIFTGEERKGDPSRWVADISNIKTLGYAPEYSITEGLKYYCRWLQE